MQVCACILFFYVISLIHIMRINRKIIMAVLNPPKLPSMFINRTGKGKYAYVMVYKSVWDKEKKNSRRVVFGGRSGVSWWTKPPEMRRSCRRTRSSSKPSGRSTPDSPRPLAFGPSWSVRRLPSSGGSRLVRRRKPLRRLFFPNEGQRGYLQKNLLSMR